MGQTKTATRKRAARPAKQQLASLTLTDLHQVKVLADPLRVRILEELCLAERTTKQVALRLGEKPTKLYHHVEALERAGLIRLTRTQQNRGTTEKYYIAVARQIKADSRIFSAADAESSRAEGTAMRAMISTMFDRTAEELHGLISDDRGQAEIEEQGLFSYLEIRSDSRHGKQFQARLMKLVKSIEGMPEATKQSSEKRYRLMVVFYPLKPDSSQ